MKRNGLTPQSYFDLVETFPQRGCAICNLLLPYADRLVQHMLYDQAVDDQTHQALRARRGLCSVHSQQITQYLGNAQTVVIFFRSAVDEVVRLLDELPGDIPPARSGLAGLIGGSSRGAALAERLAPHAPCLICQSLAEAETRYIKVMGDFLDDDRLRTAYEKSEGLCLPHFQQVLAASDDPGAIRTLIATQKRVWTQLREDLNTFIAKASETNFVYQDKGTEGDSWYRATKQMPGEDRLFGLDPRGN